MEAIEAGGRSMSTYLPSRRNFMHRSERREVPQADLSQTYSITSSARNKVAVGSVIPIAFAVFRLIANSKRSGCSTGRSAGFAPRKIFATNEAPRRGSAGIGDAGDSRPGPRRMIFFTPRGTISRVPHCGREPGMS
jgi:hypothetical protein